MVCYERHSQITNYIVRNLLLYMTYTCFVIGLTKVVVVVKYHSVDFNFSISEYNAGSAVVASMAIIHIRIRLKNPTATTPKYNEDGASVAGKAASVLVSKNIKMVTKFVFKFEYQKHNLYDILYDMYGVFRN